MPRLFTHADTGLPAIIDYLGHLRLLGTIIKPATGRYRPWREAHPKVIPESEWWEVDRRPIFDAPFILDQRNHGACVGYSSAAALMRARFLAGEESVNILSGMFVYAQINGGRDQGAVIEDAFPVLENLGVPFDVTVPCEDKYINKANIPQQAYTEAKRNVAMECYTLGSWQDTAEAILQDYVPVFPVMVGNTYDDFDAEGISGVDNGMGNHSVHGDSLLRSSKYGWKIRQPNTWGYSWGEKGCTYLRKEHLAQTFRYGAGYAIRFVRLDPQDKYPVPTVK